MTPERWEKIEQLFHSAAERNGEERAAYLEGVCAGDAELRREVESLLAHGKTADGWLGEEALKEMAEEVLDGASGVSLSGQRLGPYQLLAAIGAGGMGEVYRARDTRLNRFVAIKVLPKQVVQRKELRERLEREARTIASLNHAHICALYDVGHKDGVDYLVLEYLEGETLAERLKIGPLPLAQVLQYAIEIADALEKAHRKGITHRDLKPGNVMLTKSGTKLLDFGLAKIRQEANPAVSLSQRVTAESDITAEGTILGTLQYMAPEQVEGKTNESDARTDIFAFGAVVYEMTTGKKAFEGKSQASLIAKILETDPPLISSLQPMSPPVLDWVVKTCLAKGPDERWQSANDLGRELKWIAEVGSKLVVPELKTAQRKNREHLAWAVAASALAATLVLLTPAIERLREVRPDAPEMRTEIVAPATSDPESFALSPDGQQIVFVAPGDGSSRLWLRRLDRTEARPLAGTEGASNPFWSPDNRSVGFFADGRLKRLDLGRGSPQTLAASFGRGGTWGPDGTILFTPTATGPLFRVPASGGKALAITKLVNQYSHRFPQFLPDGRQFLFYARGTPETSGIYLGSVDSSETKRLATADTPGAYLPNGWLLFMRGGTLLAQRLNLVRKEVTGDLVPVADQVDYNAGLIVGAFSVSANGLVAYRSSGAGQQQLTWFNRSGKTLGAMGAADTSRSGWRLSPDGRRAAVDRTLDGNTEIWLVDATRTTRFTFDASRHGFPIWSPDGSRIVFDSNSKGHRDLYAKASNIGGSEELLVESTQDKTATDWSHDGRFLAYTSFDPETSRRDIWVLPMEGDRNPLAFLKTGFDERNAQFSPDSHWMAYVSNESGRYEIYVRPFNGTSSGAVGGEWQVSTSGGMSPRWRADGKELYYIAPDGKLMATPIMVNGSDFEPDAPVALFQTQIYGGGTDPNAGIQYDVSRNGRFLINTILEEGPSPITLLQNWDPGAKK